MTLTLTPRFDRRTIGAILRSRPAVAAAGVVFAITVLGTTTALATTTAMRSTPV